MTWYDTLKTYFSIVWSNVRDFPILNTGLVFKDLLFGFLGLSCLFFIFKTLFSIDGEDCYISFSLPSRSHKEKIDALRIYDER